MTAVPRNHRRTRDDKRQDHCEADWPSQQGGVQGGHASCGARQPIDGLTLQRTQRPQLPLQGRTEVFDVKSIG